MTPIPPSEIGKLTEIKRESSEERALRIRKAGKVGKPSTKRRSAIGVGEKLFDLCVDMSNEYPGYLTLSRAATILHQQDLFKEVSWKNLRNRCKTRLEKMVKAGVLLKRMEDRIDPMTGLKEGTRGVYYQEGYEGVSESDRLSSDEMQEILDSFKGTGDKVIEFVVENLKSVNQHKTIPEYKDDYMDGLKVDLGDPDICREWAAEMDIKLDPNLNQRNQIISQINVAVEWLFGEIVKMVMT